MVVIVFVLNDWKETIFLFTYMHLGRILFVVSLSSLLLFHFLFCLLSS